MIITFVCHYLSLTVHQKHINSALLNSHIACNQLKYILISRYVQLHLTEIYKELSDKQDYLISKTKVCLKKRTGLQNKMEQL